MKRLLKILTWVIIIFLIVVVSSLSYIKFILPNVSEAPDLKVEMTTNRIARGEYLANHVTVCMDCHSVRDWTRFSGPPTDGTLGMGGDVFDQKFGFPGKYYAKNITPYGIGRYSDGELFRVITTGVTKEDKALFPIMPFHYYGQMDEEDIKSIISYIRTLKPIKNDVPISSSDFPMKFIIITIQHEANFTKLPPKSDVVNYGKYLTNAAGCVECHTKFEKGGLVAGTEFGGGREFTFPNGSIVRSSNISSYNTTGLGALSEEEFVHFFRSRTDSTLVNKKLNPGDFNSVMPWTMYGSMHEEDLKAIYAYLKTVVPINNSVEKFTSAPE